jgi:2-aminoadipate transaminase
MWHHPFWMADLDSNSPVPLYRQLCSHFIKEIEAGRLQDGARIPATRELAGQLGLNRTTVSAAYELLEAEGWILAEVGRGSFVRNRKAPAVDWSRLLAPSAAFRNPPLPPVAISFAHSRPSEDLFPVDQFRQSAEAVLNGPGLSGILQLGAPAGYEPLRRYLLEQARADGNATSADDLLITNGCQQALDLLRQVLVRPGASIAVEDPVYPGVRNLFTQSAAAFAAAVTTAVTTVVTGIPVDRDGMDADSLARVRPDLAIVTPSFQNPTGATLPLARREALLRVPGTIFIENDIYSELRYRGDVLPTLKQLDPTGRVVLLRSFSKVAFPGLRVGWVIGPRPLIQRLTEAKHLTDLHTDQFSQAVLLHFVQSGRLAEHQRNMLTAGRSRLAAAVDAAEQFLPANTRWREPSGGMNLWVELPAALDAAALLPRAQASGVAFLPGHVFSLDGIRHKNALRLSFAGLTEAQITRGIQILGGIAQEELEAERSRDREPVPAMV